MASSEFHDFQRRMAAMPSAPPAASIVELRARIEAAMAPLPLADGVVAENLDLDGVPAVLCQMADSSPDDPWFLYFHGGGYRICSAQSYKAHGSQLARACKSKVLLVDYRLAPEHPFPAAVEDTLVAYRWLLRSGVPAKNVVVGGDSAGGGLTAAFLLAARDEGEPLPAGGLCLSGWLDLTNSSPSFQRNAETDLLFSAAIASEASLQYLQGQDPRNPWVSPVYGDWSGMCPLLIICGGTEVLEDDSARLAAAARDADVEVQHKVYPEMPHVWQTHYPAFPEAIAAVEQMATFIRSVTAEKS